MDKVKAAARPAFSLWPARVDPGVGDPLAPAWMRLVGGNGRGPGRVGVAELLVAAAGFVSLASAVALFADPSPLLAAGASVASAGLAGLGLAFVRSSRRKLEIDAEWRESLFERSGISLWREDWSAAARTVLALKRAGVHDIEAYFATRPDEARALRKQVIIKDVNAFTVALMGGASKAEFIGPLDRVLPTSDQSFGQWLVAFGRGDEFFRSETHLARPDGAHLECLFTAALPKSLAGFRDILVTCVDITDYKALQSQLVANETDAARSARISTMGALTASIAHEVNTPLASIVANAEASLRWLGRQPPDLEEARLAIGRAIEDAARTHEVVVRTRAFLSAAPQLIQPIDLADTARVAMVLIDRELRLHGASVHLDAGADAPLVLGDPIQMQQVLVNLMINGVQAMADRPEPRDLRVTIRGGPDEAVVSVSDRGPGVDEADREAIFEPFRSTRPSGMGMGLAICRSIVEGEGGRIWVEGDPGAGATFRFSLPAAPPNG